MRAREFDSLPEPVWQQQAAARLALAPLSDYERERRRARLAIDYTDPPAWPEWASDEDGMVWVREDLWPVWPSLNIPDVEGATWREFVGTLERIGPQVMVFAPEPNHPGEWIVTAAHPEQEDAARVYIAAYVTTLPAPVPSKESDDA